MWLQCHDGEPLCSFVVTFSHTAGPSNALGFLDAACDRGGLKGLANALLLQQILWGI